MSTRQVSFAQLAHVALGTMSEARVRANDETLACVMAARQMLNGIASGALVVAPAAPVAGPVPSHSNEEVEGAVIPAGVGPGR